MVCRGLVQNQKRCKPKTNIGLNGLIHSILARSRQTIYQSTRIGELYKMGKRFGSFRIKYEKLSNKNWFVDKESDFVENWHINIKNYNLVSRQP
jgi:hypothetical protein